MDKDTKKMIDKLCKEIKRHNRLYYAKGAPEISDSGYDGLVRELKKLEKEHPEYASPDSPTLSVGAPAQGRFRKVRHLSPMLSLESVNDEEGALHFDAVCIKEAGSAVDYMCEPKLDGLSIELVYEKGKFTRASTRGDGTTGEDVTLNITTIDNVPGELEGEGIPELLSVRGEVMMHISDFLKLNKEQTEQGKEAFANPRNAAAGSIRQLDYRVTAGRNLRVYCYEILSSSGTLPATQKGTLESLEKMGLAVSPGIRYCKSIDEAIAYHHGTEEKREKLDYEIDGIVIKVNRTEIQAKLGMRTTNPRWAVAYKFKPRREITEVEDIVVQVGRTGILTPLALLKPVEVGGVTVSRASLHNMDQVKRLGVKIGDHVKVERAGDVIPYVAEVVERKRSGKEKEFHMPSKCPSCGTHIMKEDVFYRCPAGFGCPAQVKEAIVHYASKGAVDIEGFSEKTVESFFELGIVKTISDIYKINEEDLAGLEGWKERKISNLLSAIDKAKNITLDRFVFALGIRNVGKHIASVIAKKYGSLDNIIKAYEGSLREIKEIGPEIAGSITAFFKEKKNIEQINELKKCGVKVQNFKTGSKGKLAGKKIIFTGSLRTMSRPEAQKIVEALGGEAQSSVSNDTDLVVAGKKAGSKLDKARAKGVKVISEDEFKKMII